jgi:hypothetical protein
MTNIEVNIRYDGYKDAEGRTERYLEAWKCDNMTSTGLSNECSYFKGEFAAKARVC